MMMKNKTEIESLLNGNYKEIENKLGIEIRNGQGAQGVKSALKWVLQD